MSRMQTRQLRFLPSITPAPVSDLQAPTAEVPVAPASGPTEAEQIGKALADFSPTFASLYQIQRVQKDRESAEAGHGFLAEIQSIEDPDERAKAFRAIRQKNKKDISRLAKQQGFDLVDTEVFWSTLDEQSARLDAQTTLNELQRRAIEDRVFEADNPEDVQSGLDKIIAEVMSDKLDGISNDRYQAFYSNALQQELGNISARMTSENLKYHKDRARQSLEAVVISQSAALTQGLADGGLSPEEIQDMVMETAEQIQQEIEDSTGITVEGSEANQIVADSLEARAVALARDGRPEAGEMLLEVLDSLKSGPVLQGGRRASLGETRVGSIAKSRGLGQIDRIRATLDAEEDRLAAEEDEAQIKTISIEAADQLDASGFSPSYLTSPEFAALRKRARAISIDEEARLVNRLQGFIAAEQAVRDGEIKAKREDYRMQISQMQRDIRSLDPTQRREGIAAMSRFIEQGLITPAEERAYLSDIEERERISQSHNSIIRSSDIDNIVRRSTALIEISPGSMANPIGIPEGMPGVRQVLSDEAKADQLALQEAIDNAAYDYLRSADELITAPELNSHISAFADEWLKSRGYDTTQERVRQLQEQGQYPNAPDSVDKRIMQANPQEFDQLDEIMDELLEESGLTEDDLNALVGPRGTNLINRPTIAFAAKAKKLMQQYREDRSKGFPVFITAEEKRATKRLSNSVAAEMEDLRSFFAGGGYVALEVAEGKSQSTPPRGTTARELLESFKGGSIPAPTEKPRVIRDVNGDYRLVTDVSPELTSTEEVEASPWKDMQYLFSDEEVDRQQVKRASLSYDEFNEMLRGQLLLHSMSMPYGEAIDEDFLRSYANPEILNPKVHRMFPTFDALNRETAAIDAWASKVKDPNVDSSRVKKPLTVVLLERFGQEQTPNNAKRLVEYQRRLLSQPNIHDLISE